MFAKVAPGLFELGYPVLPAHGKAVTLLDWQNLAITEEQVSYWANNGQAQSNVGIRCGDDSVCGVAVGLADFDIYDLDVCRRVRASFIEHMGAAGVLRVGQAPKTGMVYRVVGGLPKLTSPVWVSADGRKHKFELLMSGQQFVGYGTHPDTNKEYRWPEGGLEEREPWELPLLDRDKVDAWMRDVLPGLLPGDWVIEVGSGSSLPRSSDPLDSIVPRLDIEDSVIDRVMKVLDPDMDHDSWVRIGMGLQHQLGEDGFAVWAEWSRRGSKFSGEGELRAKWRSFEEDAKGGGRRPVTFASALKMARESEGWDEAVKAEKVEALAGWLEKIAGCADAHDLQSVAEKGVAFDKGLSDMDRAQIVAALQTRAQELTGVRPTKDIVVRWVKKKSRQPLPDISMEGYPLETARNLATVCANLDVVIRYNVITKNDEILIPGASFSEDNRDNASLAWLIDALHREEIRSSHVKDFVTMLADGNQFNPVMTWIESRPWDGVSRLGAFYGTVRERKDEIAPGLKEILMRRWAVAAVRAAAHPDGIAAQGVLVFQGIQYAGKTRWVKSLAPVALKVIHEGLTLDPKNKDLVKIAIMHWIVELGELDSTFKKAEISALKGFITQPHDIFRKPFAKAESQFARRTVFTGSVNDEQFLQDPTGNRRFWTIPVESIDHDHGLDMQQVWAEVYELYKAGEKHYLSPEEMAMLNDHNVQFTAQSPIAELVSTRLDWENSFQPDVPGGFRWMTSSDVLRWLEIKNPSRFDSTEAGREISKHNGGRKRKSHGHMLRAIPLRRRSVSGEYLDEGISELPPNGSDTPSDTPLNFPF